LFALSFSKVTSAQDDIAAGKTLFQGNCAACHQVIRESTGPALAGIEERVPDRQLLHDWIRNNQKVLATGDKYFNDLYLKYNKTPMNLFNGWSDADIENILAYVKDEEKKAAAAPAVVAGDTKTEGKDNTLLFGILTLILAIIALILLQVNSNLKKLSDDKE